jgi:hypothetical protein
VYNKGTAANDSIIIMIIKIITKPDLRPKVGGKFQGAEAHGFILNSFFFQKKNTHCPAPHVYHELLEVLRNARERKKTI